MASRRDRRLHGPLPFHLLLLLSLLFVLYVSGARPVVRVSTGLVEGVTLGSVNQFFGIPYAQPPTGNARWREPTPGR